MFYHIQNGEEDYVYNEVKKFNVFDGLELCPPFHADNYNITVGSESTCTIIIRQSLIDFEM